MAFYRNKTTGLIQHHPVSGIGDSLNSVEIEETGRPIKPRTSKAPSADERRRANQLIKDNSPSKKTTGNQAVDSKEQKGAK